MNDVIMPDFDKWARNILTHHMNILHPAIELVGDAYLIQDIRNSLKQSFDQGLTYGKRVVDHSDKFNGVF